MKKIAFFLSAQDIDPKYTEPALKLIKLCVEHGYGFIYGGSEYGFMKQASQFVRDIKGHITAVSSEEFREVLSPDCDEIFVMADVLERKRTFLEKADAIVALPGGTGTLDEIADIIAKKKLNNHNKPIVFLNTENFWNGLIEQYNHMHAEGFIPKDPNEIFVANDNPEEVFKYLQNALD